LKVEINLTKQKNMDLLILQTDGNVVESTQKTLSIIELLLKGGWLMIPMAVLSFITIYIFVERYLTISKANRIDDKFMPAIRDYVINGNIEAAKALCRQTDTPVARMIEKGISRIGKPLKNIEVAIENVGKLEVYKTWSSVVSHHFRHCPNAWFFRNCNRNDRSIFCYGKCRQ
jgi:biopolymer transport protein ExbB